MRWRVREAAPGNEGAHVAVMAEHIVADEFREQQHQVAELSCPL